MLTLDIDIETFSSEDLKKSGVYRYTESPDFEILLFGYSLNGGPEKVIDLANGEELPADVRTSLTNPRVLKGAHNANFERTCISKHFSIECDPAQWECSMARAALVGLPLGLGEAAKVLGITEGKMQEGKTLIKYFCVPCKPTKINGKRTRNLPEHDIEKWEAFKAYCIRDVQVEKKIKQKIRSFPMPETEKKLWVLDQQINDRGVLMDPVLIKNAIQFDKSHGTKLRTEAVVLTDLDNPNSPAQLKKWLHEQTGDKVASLNKEALSELVETTDDQTVKRVLEIRQQASKSSVKKYEAMLSALCDDDRLRGMFQYGGANRTMRWAGRIVQPHNLPRNYLLYLDMARRFVRNGELELLQVMLGNVSRVLSQLIRTSFIPAPGHRFIITDFSAIEARVIAWLAGEKWRLDVFDSHGKIYEASASQMFKVPIEAVKKGSIERDAAKIAELALGYQGSVGAMQTMIRQEKTRAYENDKVWTYEPDEAEMLEVVKKWRSSNPKIVKCWSTVEDCAWSAVQDGIQENISHGISMWVEKNVLFIKLPSGRRLAYLKPRIGVSRQGGLGLTYEGLDQVKKVWLRHDTYGGKLVENIVQAVARDCLAEAMLRLDKEGYRIVMHVHDEVVLEAPNGQGSLEEVNRIMGEPIAWAKGLPLKAESFECNYYKKD